MDTLALLFFVLAAMTAGGWALGIPLIALPTGVLSLLELPLLFSRVHEYHERRMPPERHLREPRPYHAPVFSSAGLPNDRPFSHHLPVLRSRSAPAEVPPGWWVDDNPYIRQCRRVQQLFLDNFDFAGLPGPQPEPVPRHVVGVQTTRTRQVQSVVASTQQQQQLEGAQQTSGSLKIAPGSSTPQPQEKVVERAAITWQLSFSPFPSPLPVPPVCDADIVMAVAPCDTSAEDAELTQRKRPRDDDDDDEGDEPARKRRLGRTVPVPVYTELPDIGSQQDTSTSSSSKQPSAPAVANQTASDNALQAAVVQRTAAAIYCDTPTPPVPTNGACTQCIYCDTPTPPLPTPPRQHVPVAVPTQSASTVSRTHETQDREQAQDKPTLQEQDERDEAAAQEKDADDAEDDVPAMTTAAAAPELQGPSRAMEANSDEETEEQAEGHESEVTLESVVAMFMDPRRLQPLTPRQETKLSALLLFNSGLVAELARNTPERAQQPTAMHELLEQAAAQQFHPRALLDAVCLAAHVNERVLRKTVRTAVMPGDPAQTVMWPVPQRHKHSAQQLLDEGPAHGEESPEWYEDEVEDDYDYDYDYDGDEEEEEEVQGPRAPQKNAEDSESDQ
eukprot:m51a1_g8314 hypothetical protein (617) ;mRNA; r:94899-98808